jgi:integral membrane protein
MRSSCGGNCSTKSRDRGAEPDTNAIRRQNNCETTTRSSPNTTGTSQTCEQVTNPDETDEVVDPEAVRAALGRYRVMAYVVGIGLILLVAVGVPLQYGAGTPQVAEIVGPVHGLMYIVYLAAAVDLARRCQLSTRQLAVIALAGFLPFLAFFVERRITRSVLNRSDS